MKEQLIPLADIEIEYIHDALSTEWNRVFDTLNQTNITDTHRKNLELDKSRLDPLLARFRQMAWPDSKK